MADRKQSDRTQDNVRNQGLQHSRGRGDLATRDPFTAFWNDPFSFFQSDWPSRFFGQTGQSSRLFSPQIETLQRGDQFVVRADLPGLDREDVSIDITDDSVIIQGERREERTDDREGYYRTERSYGSFYRVVPLPEGAITENAKANFNNGVLEITIQVPPREVSRRRRIEIGGASARGRDEQSERNERGEAGRSRTESER
jgi:HSP20 family molecular chaperone IbpA